MFATQTLDQARKEIAALDRFAEHFADMDEALFEMAGILRSARRREDDPEYVDFRLDDGNAAAFREYVASFESEEHLEQAIANLWQELKPAHAQNAALRGALDSAEHAVNAAVRAMETVGPSAGSAALNAVNDSIAMPLGALWFNFTDARTLLDALEADGRGRCQ